MFTNYNGPETTDRLPVKSKNTNSSISSLYEARKFYKDSTIPFIETDYLELLDPVSFDIRKIPFSDVYERNGFYGIVDNELDIVTPLVDKKFYKSVGVNEEKPVFLMDFVADAFNDMKKYLSKQNLKNISGNSIFLKLEAKKGYQELNGLYLGNNLITSDRFREFSLKDKQLDSRVRDYKDFLKEYILFLKQTVDQMPVTKSSTVSYYNLDVLGSGLAVLISNDDPGDDVKKYLDYYLDPGFLCFSEACIRFGFKFDKNMPFLLLADIASPAMKPYLLKYGINNANDLFKKRFKKTYEEDLESLKLNFYVSYHNFLYQNDTYGEDYSKLCSKDASKNTKKVRVGVSKEKFFKDFPDTYWMRLYVYFKNLELKANFTQQQFENVVRVANEYVKLNKNIDGLKFVNSRFNPFKGVKFFDTLLENKSVLQTIDQPVGAQSDNFINF